MKHVFHRRDAADVPRADVLIERGGSAKRVIHARDAADVPRTDVLIEHRGVLEHAFHARDAADVPRADVLIEQRGGLEDLTHVRYVTGACGHEWRVNLCINKRIDLSFRSLGVRDTAHPTCVTHSGKRTYDRYFVLSEVERLFDRYACSSSQ